MSAWVEVMVQGNCRAFLDASHIRGVLSPSGLGANEVATVDQPMGLILGSSELHGIHGISATRLLFRVEGLKEYMRQTNMKLCVAYLDDSEGFDEQLMEVLGGTRNGETI